MILDGSDAKEREEGEEEKDLMGLKTLLICKQHQIGYGCKVLIDLWKGEATTRPHVLQLIAWSETPVKSDH